MRFAYADPPYIGQAKRHYDKEAASNGRVAAEVDHERLIAHLVAEYPDGWALSCSSPSLKELLPMCPESVRILGWVKPWVAFHKNVRVVYAWEPVLVMGGRKGRTDVFHDFTPDWHMASRPTGAVKKNNTPTGAKPITFCLWLLDVLGFQAGDTLDDLFPGTGVMTRAVEFASGQSRLPLL